MPIFLERMVLSALAAIVVAICITLLLTVFDRTSLIEISWQIRGVVVVVALVIGLGIGWWLHRHNQRRLSTSPNAQETGPQTFSDGVVQGDSNTMVQGDSNTIVQGDSNTINISVTEREQNPQFAGIIESHTVKISELSSDLGATKATVVTVLRMLGHEVVDEEHLPRALAAVATEFLEMRKALDDSPVHDSEIAALRRRALASLNKGAITDAIQQLEVIRTRQRAASEQSLSDAKAALGAEAETCILLVRAALLQNDLPGALGQFESGWQVLQEAPEVRWSYSMNAAGIFFIFGDRAGSNDALAAAVEICRRTLTYVTNDRRKWALTQLNLGVALGKLGELEEGTANLIAADAALGKALTELTRENAAEIWAQIHLNLGNVHRALFEREYVGGSILSEGIAGYMLSPRLTDHILKAHGHYQNSLKVWTREGAPFKWATSQMNMGLVLMAVVRTPLGDPKQIEAVLGHYGEALKVWTKDNAPFQWAMLQANRGIALSFADENKRDPAILDAAIAAYNAALDVFIATKSDYYSNVIRERRDRLQARADELRPRSNAGEL